jgi:hypothetical protein
MFKIEEFSNIRGVLQELRQFIAQVTGVPEHSASSMG